MLYFCGQFKLQKYFTSIQQIIKHGAIHLDAVFAISTLSGLEAVVVVTCARNECARYDNS